MHPPPPAAARARAVARRNAPTGDAHVSYQRCAAFASAFAVGGTPAVAAVAAVAPGPGTPAAASAAAGTGSATVGTIPTPRKAGTAEAATTVVGAARDTPRRRAAKAR